MEEINKLAERQNASDDRTLFDLFFSSFPPFNNASRPLWARITKNTDWSTGPLTHPFARLLAPPTHSLAPHYSLCSRAPLRSLRSWDSDKLDSYLFCVFFYSSPQCTSHLHHPHRTLATFTANINYQPSLPSQPIPLLAPQSPCRVRV